jgi:hypothetical protein
MSRRPLSADDQADLQGKVMQGASARQFAEFGRTVLVVDQERLIFKQVFEIIDSGEPLDPLFATQKWIELRAAHKLVSRLEGIAKAGITAQDTLDHRTPKAE